MTPTLRSYSRVQPRTEVEFVPIRVIASRAYDEDVTGQ